jgi:hypothetical protein
MDALRWNMLLAGVGLIVIGLAGLVGFGWNLRRGVAGYAEDIRKFHKQIGNRYADDVRGIWMLAVTKLAALFGLGIVMFAGGVLFIYLANNGL